MIVALPLFLIYRKPGSASPATPSPPRQMLWSALLIHLSGGRIETHFHIFGSLAFLAFYRDWRVLVTASLRGRPPTSSCAGCTGRNPSSAPLGAATRGAGSNTSAGSFSRTFSSFTPASRANDGMRGRAMRQAELEDSRSSVERAVSERTAQLAQTNRDLGRQVGERQRIEQELRAAHNELESKVRERTAELGAPPTARSSARSTRAARPRRNSRAPCSVYRFTTDSVPQIVWTARPDGAIDYFNRRFHEYTGLTIEESVGWGWLAVLHPDDVAPLRRTSGTTAVQTGAVFEIEYRLRRGRDGAYRWHLGRAMPMRDPDGNIVQWFGTCTDIDDQKRSREIATRSEQRYRSLVAASAQIVWLADAECRVTAGHARMARRHRPELRGDERLRLAGCHPSRGPRAGQPNSGAGRWKPARVYENEHRMRMRRRPVPHFSIARRARLESNGRIREWIGTSTDITERKQAEEVVRRAQEDLEARVRERTAQLTETNRILHQQVDRAEADRGRTGRGARRRPAQRQAQEPVPGQHEPRNPHAHERRHRHDEPAARHARSTRSSASTSRRSAAAATRC